VFTYNWLQQFFAFRIPSFDPIRPTGPLGKATTENPMRFLLAILLLSFLSACDTQPPPPVSADASPAEPSLPAKPQTAEQSIKADNLLADASIIASDDFEGRGAGTEGDRKARAFFGQPPGRHRFRTLF
jgi:hypothetical protein